MTSDFLCPSHFIATYKETVGLVGEVVEKNFQNKNTVKYKITDGNTQVSIVCIIHDFCSYDGMTFKETHEEIQIGDHVEIIGRPGMSRNSVPILYCSSIYKNEDCDCDCDCDCDYESESECESEADSDSDPDYETETLSSSDNDSDYESDSEETECSEDSEDSVIYQVDVEEIPLTINNNTIVYQGRKFDIEEVITTTPLQITLTTEIGPFVITEMIPGRFIGIRVPKNNLEKNLPNGYDIIIEEDFENIVKVLYR